MAIIVQWFAAITLLAAVQGCVSPAYYVQTLNGHAKILSARQNVETLANDPAQPGNLRSELALAHGIRQFAIDELALPDNASYRSYVETGRDFVTWAVFAAPEFSLDPQTTCFPIYGCVPYRGYFSEKTANEYAQALRDKGMDVFVAGIPAYSTLGLTADPLLNTMFLYGENYLAGVVFHELAHQRVYIRGDTTFNEAFAVAVERTGVKKWLLSRGDNDRLRNYDTNQSRTRDFLGLIAGTRSELATIYTSDQGADAKRAAKAATIRDLNERYRRLRDERWAGNDQFDFWFEQPVNNARLATISVYNELVPEFLRLFELCGDNYERFYEAVSRLGKLPKSDRVTALRAARHCG